MKLTLKAKYQDVAFETGSGVVALKTGVAAEVNFTDAFFMKLAVESQLVDVLDTAKKVEPVAAPVAAPVEAPVEDAQDGSEGADVDGEPKKKRGKK